MDIRHADFDDLPAIVAMLADDPLGASRERLESPPPRAYIDAFAQMNTEESDNHLLVAEINGEVVACLQLTFIPGISRLGMTRAQIEGVRVHADHRGKGIGEALFKHAITRAKARGCGLVQLTTDLTRPEAKKFYDALGFVASHAGMKLAL